MNVTFKYGSSANLGNLTVTNGQIIACSDTGALYYDIGGARRPVYTLPQGTASVRGGVYLSDSYTSSAGTAAAGVAASSYALYSCYTSLNALYNEVKKSAADGKAMLASTISNQGVSTASDAAFSTINTNINTLATNKYNSGYNAGQSGGYNNGYNAAKSAYGCSKQRTVLRPYERGRYPLKGEYQAWNLSANHYFELTDCAHFVIETRYYFNGVEYEQNVACDIEDIWGTGNGYYRIDMPGFDIYIYDGYSIVVMNHDASIDHLAIIDYQVDAFIANDDNGTDDVSVDYGYESSFDPGLFT